MAIAGFGVLAGCSGSGLASRFAGTGVIDTLPGGPAARVVHTGDV